MFNRLVNISWLRHFARVRVVCSNLNHESTAYLFLHRCIRYRSIIGSVVSYASAWSYLKTQLGYSGLNNSLFEDADLKQKIRIALMFLQQERYDEAENRLHACLQEAEERNNEPAVTYIFDVLANLFYMKKDYELAEKSFLDLMRRLLASGRAEDDPALIEISLKLSDIYASKGDLEKAESGFMFAVDKQRSRLSQLQRKQGAMMIRPKLGTEESYSVSNDVQALLGMSLEAYARFLIGQKRFTEGDQMFTEALQLSAIIFGPTHQQTIVMLNNYSTICLRMRNFEAAERNMVEVVRRSRNQPELADMVPGFYCNLAEAQWHLGKHGTAVENARTAVRVALKGANESVVKQCQQYLDSLGNDYVDKYAENKT